MYIMSQDGARLEKLCALAIGCHPDGKRKVIRHYTPDGEGQVFAVYPTEPEAKAQLAGIADALIKGRPLYCFD